ncbi:FtsX-like permease family protein [Glycomyces tarimensis]
MRSSLRLAFRIARREALRYKGRSVLSIALLGLPMLAVSLAVSAYDTTTLSPLEEVEQRVGDNEAFIRFEAEGEALDQLTWDDYWPAIEWEDGDTTTEDGAPREVPESEVLAALPEGATLSPYNVYGSDGSERVETPDGIGSIETYGWDLSDPAYQRAGVEILEGEVPRGDEVALSAKAADYLEVGLGDAISVVDGESRIEHTVVGIVEIPWNLTSRFAISPALGAEAHGWLVDAPEELSPEQAFALNDLGMSVWAAPFVENPPSQPDWAQPVSVVNDFELMIYGLIGTAVLIEVILLAGPAFAISARRRTREFALMSASGATPGHIRNTVLAGGFLFGTIAAVVAVVLGITAVWALMPLLEQFVGHRSAGLRVMPATQAVVVVFAVGTGLLAALAAAMSASRINVVAALSGRTPRRRPSRRWLILGLVLIAGGLVSGFAGVSIWSLPLMSAAIVGLQLGLVACTPTLVALIAKLGRWLPLAPRMALREAGRNGNSTAPAIAAVLGVVAAGIAFSFIVTADTVRLEEKQQRLLPAGAVTLDLSHNGGMNEGTADFETASLESEMVLSRELDDLETIPVPLYSGPENCDVDDRFTASEEENLHCYVELTRPEENRCPYWSADLSTEAAKEAALEEAREDPRCDEEAGEIGGFSEEVAVSTDPRVVAAYSDLEGAELDAAVEFLESGGILVSDPWAITDDGTVVVQRRATVWRESGDEDLELDAVELPAMEVDKGLLGYMQIFLGPAAAEELGLTESDWSRKYLIETSTEVTGAVEERIASGFNDAFAEGTVWVQFSVVDYTDPFAFYFALAVASLCALVALGATAISTGLIIAESGRDMTTLGAVGATPGVRKRFAMWQTVVIALLGAGLGTLAGIIGYALVREALNRNLQRAYPFEVLYGWDLPWVNIGISLLAVPLIAAAGALVFTKAKLPSERRLT